MRTAPRVCAGRWLLRQRPDAVNAASDAGRRPLHAAAASNHVEMCKILLDAGADPNPVARAGRTGRRLVTPLDAALHRGFRGCAKFVQLRGGVPASKITDKEALEKALSRWVVAQI